MKKIPKVSVLMPNYNGEKYISEAIESILDQTFSDFEFIIIDDGSTDRSWEIIQEYAQKDERIVSLKNKENLGVGKTRNKLIEKAKSEFIMWQDSDDIAMLDRIKNQYKYLLKNKDIGNVGGTLLFYNGSKVFGKREYSNDDLLLKKKIFRQSPVALPGSMMRKNIVKEVGLFDSNLTVAEDLDLSYRIGMISKFGNINKPVIKYRDDGAGLTNSKLGLMEMRTISLRLKYTGIGPYKMSFGDHFYNILQYISIFIIPIKLKIWIFNLLRNS